MKYTVWYFVSLKIGCLSKKSTLHHVVSQQYSHKDVGSKQQKSRDTDFSASWERMIIVSLTAPS